MKIPISIVPRLFLKPIQPLGILFSKKASFVYMQANAIMSFFVKMVVMKTYKLTYKQKLEILFYHSYRKAIIDF